METPDTRARAPGSGIARWGSACGPCASAKAKCIRSSTVPGDKCDRCQRLFKECAPQVHVPRKKRVFKGSKTAQLEERLNGIVEILKATRDISVPSSLTQDDVTCIPTEADDPVPVISQRQPTPTTSAADSPSPTESTINGASAAGAIPHDTPLHSSTTSPSHHQPHQHIPPTYNCYAPPACICRPRFKGPPPNRLPDDELLHIYRTELFHVYPFVVIPPTVSAAELSATRPFLMQAIRTVGSYRYLHAMQHNAHLTMQHLSEHMLIRSSRSLDLLLGIIVFVGWYHTHCLMHAQLNNCVHLAFSLVADLELHRDPQLNERVRLMVMHPVEPPARTLEERRAMLGTWYLSSILNVGFGRVESLTYTKYIQSSLFELDSAREYESDAVLVTLIRIQRLTAEIHHLQTGESIGESDGGGGCDSSSPLSSIPVPRAPHSAYIAAFQAELDRLRTALPRSLRTNKTIEASLATAQLHLYEPPVITAALVQSLSSPIKAADRCGGFLHGGIGGSGSGSLGGGGGLHSLDVLYHANTALKRWFDTFQAMPLSVCLTLPMGMAIQLIYAITMLTRWAKLTAPWMDVGGSGAAGGNEPRQQSLPPAMAALKSHLWATPGLALDIPATLEAMTNRFEAIIADLDQAAPKSTAMVEGGAEQCTGPGEPITSIWELGVRKIRITRVKMDRISKMAALGNLGTQGGRQDNNGGRQRAVEEAEVGDDDGDGDGRGDAQHACVTSIEAEDLASRGGKGREPFFSARPPPQHQHGLYSQSHPQNGGGGYGLDARSAGSSTAVSSVPTPLSHTTGAGGGIPAPGTGGMPAGNMMTNPGMPAVLSMAEGAEWLKNTFWASNDIFDGLDPNMWWDGTVPATAAAAAVSGFGGEWGPGMPGAGHPGGMSGGG